MIAKMSLLPVALMSLVACGGDDPKPMVTTPDAKVFMDAPPPPECSVDKAGFGNLGLGTAMAPVSGDWFIMPTSGPYNGKVVFALGGTLGDPQAPIVDSLNILLPKNANGNFPMTATDLDTTGTPTATTPAYAFILGDYVKASMELTNLYWPSTGAITVTAIGETDGAAITGSVSMMNFREVDDQGSDIAGGCTTKIGGLSFNLKQMAMAATGKGNDDNVLDPATLTPKERLEIVKMIAAGKLQRLTPQ
jgi:hypothetical protein